MSIRVVNAEGAASSTAVKLPKAKAVSEVALNQTVQSLLANQRRQRPLAKTRGEVRGGGAKPHRQKGTGRARAGSSRSPLWRGGGITFGPSGESRPLKHINRKLARTALLTVLNRRADDGTLIVVTGNVVFEKTSQGQVLLRKLDLSGRALIVVTTAETSAVRGLDNLAGVTVQTASGLTLPELAGYTTIVLTRSALEELIGASNNTSARSATASAAKASSGPAKAVRKPATKPKPSTGKVEA